MMIMVTMVIMVVMMVMILMMMRMMIKMVAMIVMMIVGKSSQVLCSKQCYLTSLTVQFTDQYQYMQYADTYNTGSTLIIPFVR